MKGLGSIQWQRCIKNNSNPIEQYQLYSRTMPLTLYKTPQIFPQVQLSHHHRYPALTQISKHPSIQRINIPATKQTESPKKKPILPIYQNGRRIRKRRQRRSSISGARPSRSSCGSLESHLQVRQLSGALSRENRKHS